MANLLLIFFSKTVPQRYKIYRTQLIIFFATFGWILWICNENVPICFFDAALSTFQLLFSQKMVNMVLENEFWTKKVLFSDIIEKFKCDLYFHFLMSKNLIILVASFFSPVCRISAWLLSAHGHFSLTSANICPRLRAENFCTNNIFALT